MIFILASDIVSYKRIELDHFIINHDNIADKTSDDFCASQYDFIILLNSLKENFKVLGIQGGFSGYKLRSTLENYLIETDFVTVKDELRNKIEISDIENTTAIVSKAPRLTRDDSLTFVDKFEDKIYDARVVVLIEDYESNLSEDSYISIMNICRNYRKKIFLAANSKILALGFDNGVYAVALSAEDLSDMIKIKFQSNLEFVKLSSFLVEGDTEIAAVSFNNKLYFFKKGTYHIMDDKYSRKIDEKKALMGLALAFEREYDIDTAFKMAGAFSLIDDVRNVSMTKIKTIMNEIEIDNFIY